MIKIFLSLLLLFFSFFSCLTAQYDNLKFSCLTVDNGLSEDAVNSVFQDSKGFMWFGTPSGLNRYDGHNFKLYSYNPGKAGSISSNDITRIYEDREGVLWIGTLSGDLNRYDRKLDKFTVYKHDPNDSNTISGRTIRVIFEDSRGNLWIGVRDKGVDMFDRKNNIFKHNLITARNPSGYGRVIWGMCEDKYGNLWMGSSGNGLFMLDAGTGKLNNFLEHPEDSSNLSDDKILCVYLDKNEDLWMGTMMGLKKLSLAEYYKTGIVSFKKYPGNIDGSGDAGTGLINSICEDSNGILWLGTQKGLYLFNRADGTFKVYNFSEHAPNGLLGKTITSIYRDKSGIIWMGVFATMGNNDRGGINFFDSRHNRFNVHWYKPGLPNSLKYKMYSVPCEDDRGNLWYINDKNSICAWNRTDNKIKKYTLGFIEKRELVSLFIDSNNEFWISVGGRVKQESVLGKFDPYTGKLNSRISQTADEITEDKFGLFWCRFDGGIFSYNQKNNQVRFYTHDEKDSGSIDNNQTEMIFVDSDSDIWVQTRRGLNKLDRKTEKFTRYYSFPGTGAGGTNRLSNDYVTGMYDDNRGNIWFATYGGGLNKYDKKSAFVYINKDSGLADNFISSFLVDEHGNFWMGTKQGISKYNPQNGNIRNYSTEDGLQGKEFTFPAFKTRSGEMFFGGYLGLNSFYPDSIKDNWFVPPTVLTGFNVFDKEIELDTSIVYKKEITLPYDSNFFSLEFSALSFTNPSANKYMYKLEGVDKNWISTGASARIANYTDVAPGEYIFCVKGSNNDGIWDEEGASVKIIITPPWWKTWWFRGFVIFLVIGGLWYSRKRKLSSITKELEQQAEFTKQLINAQEAERKRIAGELHDGLGQNLLVIKNRLLLKIQKDRDGDMDDISSLASKTIEEVRTISRNLRPYEIDRLGLTEAIESIIDNAGNSSGVNLKSEIDNIDNLFSPENEINFYRIIQECITNILKHSNAKRAEIRIAARPGSVEVRISDDGSGFDMAKLKTRSAGMGLSGMQERVNILKGHIVINSEPGKGTEINIIIKT